MNATEEHVATLCRDMQSRFETIRLLIAAMPRRPDPPPQQPDPSLRRTISRLRAGRIRPADGAVDAGTLAETLERELEYRQIGRAVIKEIDAVREMLRSELDATAARLLEQILTLFHDAKHLPAAADPESEVSECIRLIDRARRSERFGRRRRAER